MTKSKAKSSQQTYLTRLLRVIDEIDVEMDKSAEKASKQKRNGKNGDNILLGQPESDGNVEYCIWTLARSKIIQHFPEIANSANEMYIQKREKH